MKNVNLETPLSQLTVAEFLEISKSFLYEKKYEYGLKGLAKILGCSVSKASEIKSSGILDAAIIQRKNIIIIDKEKALQLFSEK
ncbi:DUF3853 family protein [Chryseobacterium indologenes]|uniref:DUF3853 family protein n=1 Tax=Chryseobacterium oryzae TaxID=2929799 RepID=A0ABY4BE65_9FLAO|nr:MULTISPECIES: DUF3853 family protein [Chryseobacterium]AYZ35215.1 DUF3853 family protein [Chryseobacterium indologenes]MEB4761459.1 DUF3853 family protein [Chryseobacterium indologenes]OCK51418.1 hypothetical protein BA768_16640 [Chryseobacterium sp. CBo1]UEQ78031.1 DUF3853 family protein [Chryseobacterium arthrosphaerae]UOE37444.1 DUF3853 family protein [Chryseobacterium oryzae]